MYEMAKEPLEENTEVEEWLAINLLKPKE
jgi:hypothetical protein